MREVRATAAAAVLLCLITAPAFGQCVSSVTTISERGDNTRFLAGPTAWHGHILAVAGAERDKVAFQVVLYDEAGNPLAEPQKIRSSGEDLLDVIWNGQDFGVFSITDDDELALTRVDTEGKVIGPRILSIAALQLAGDDTARIVWSSVLNRYVVVHTRTTDLGKRTIYVSWLTREGKVTETTLIRPAADDSFVRIAIAATGTVGIFYEDEVTNELQYVAVDGFKNSKPVTVWDEGDDIVVAPRNDEFALVRPELRSGKTIARWLTIDTSGNNVRRDNLLNLESEFDVEPLFLIGRDSEYALSYLEWREGLGQGEPIYRLARFGPNEEPISDEYFAAATGTRRRRERTDFGFVWTGSAYVSLGSDDNGDDRDTVVIRFCPLRAAISAPRSARPSQLVSFVADVEGGVPEYTYTWSWAGGSASGPILTTSFPNFGVYEVRLTVEDAVGMTSANTFQVTINQIRRRPVRK
jgi:hypothetical protein